MFSINICIEMGLFKGYQFPILKTKIGMGICLLRNFTQTDTNLQGGECESKIHDVSLCFQLGYSWTLYLRNKNTMCRKIFEYPAIPQWRIGWPSGLKRNNSFQGVEWYFSHRPISRWADDCSPKMATTETPTSNKAVLTMLQGMDRYDFGHANRYWMG